MLCSLGTAGTEPTHPRACAPQREEPPRGETEHNWRVGPVPVHRNQRAVHAAAKASTAHINKITVKTDRQAAKEETSSTSLCAKQ